MDKLIQQINLRLGDSDAAAIDEIAKILQCGRGKAVRYAIAIARATMMGEAVVEKDESK